MSAQLDSLPRYRRMTGADLEAVLRIEEAVYPYPWSRGNFNDSLAAGYHCWIVECAGEVVGYTVVMIAAGEGHLLNLSVAAEWQRRGIGRELLAFVTKLTRDYGAPRTTRRSPSTLRRDFPGSRCAAATIRQETHARMP
jgi:[ribosomal protein S18]-alanine N-acetyltransferase